MKNYPLLFKLLCFLVITNLSYTANAQKSPAQLEAMRKRILENDKVGEVILSTKRQTPDFISLKTAGKALTKIQAQSELANYLKVRPGIDKLTQVDEKVSPGGESVVKFQQYFKAVKVDRATYTAYASNGTVNFYNGAWYDIPASLPVTPGLTMTKALEYAKLRVGAKKYVADEIKNAIALTKSASDKKILEKELQQSLPKGELVLINDFSKAGIAEVKLAYKFDIYAAEPLSRSWVYVDANNGNILLIDAIIKHVGNPGSPLNTTGLNSVATSVQTRYAGVRNIQVKQISGNDPNSGLPLTASNPTEIYVPGTATFALIDDTRGKGIETYDLNGIGGLPVSLPVYSQGKSFTDVNNNWTLAEHRRGSTLVESENDDIAWDAHWGAGIVYDYWKQNHNRLSFDGNNAKIKSFIHSGLAYDNAFWNGSVMTYGDGSGTAAMGFKPLTSLDVCGHEIGHGVCEFTANLVYAKESGAMNEGLSDIWASCIEYFAIKKVDPSLAAVYRPFYIGEQISADPNNPLRRMDDPKAQGNPDTYGGVNWTDQSCTPTLANDQCGVHGNSGVMNKWFYLLTVGSGAGSGPDAAFAGADDGINDAVTTGPVADQHPANAYSVTGLGFLTAQKITFLTEQLLSSTATYAEARRVAIAVATQLSGNPCSAMVEAVTNAWYAVGVGGKFIKPCSLVYGFVYQPGASVIEAATPAGCISSKTYSTPILIPANSTATLAVSGTATLNADYTVSSVSFTNTTTSAAKKDLVITVLNDGAIEPDETIILTLTLTNTGTATVNKSFTLTLLNDDVIPVIGSSQKTLLNETFTRADGFADPAGWTEKLEIPETSGDPMATGKNQWGIFDNKLSITGKEGLTGIQLPNNTYNNLSESQTLIRTGLIDGRGLSVLNLKFDYSVQGEIDPVGTDPENFPGLDYFAVAYSLDGINFTELTTGNFRQFASLTPASGTFSGILPPSVSNKQFYLAFRWKNDANAGGPMSATIDNLLLTGAPRTIENQLAHNSRETLAPGQDVYFYSVQDGEIVARIKNNSTGNLGCTNTSIEKAGNSTFNLYLVGNTARRVSDKVVRIDPTNNLKAATVLTLYYTEAQLVAVESATKITRNKLNIYQVTGTSYSTATSANTVRFIPVYSAIPGLGGSYTISFNAALKGSFALGAEAAAALPRSSVQNISGNEISEKFRMGSLYPNPVNSTVNFKLTSPVSGMVIVDIVSVDGQQVYTQTKNLVAGKTPLSLPVNRLAKGSYRLNIRDKNGKILNSQQFLKE